MGSYKLEDMDEKFRLASVGIESPMRNLIVPVAKAAFNHAPDNHARDQAISHLISAVEIFTVSYLMEDSEQPMKLKNEIDGYVLEGHELYCAKKQAQGKAKCICSSQSAYCWPDEHLYNGGNTYADIEHGYES